MDFISSLLLFCMLISYNSASGQEWRKYDETNSSLGNSYVRDIVIDSNGVAWLGTSEDLFSFDGLNWNHYTINVTNSNPNITYVEDMCLLNNNDILIGTSYGICIFNTLTKTVDYSLNSNIPFSHIESVGQSDDGIIWIGESVTGGRIAYFSNYSWATFQAFGSSETIYAMTNNGNEMWFGSGSVKKYDNGIFTQYYYGNSPITQGALTSALAFDPDGNLWLDAPSNAVPTIYRLMKFDGINWYEYDTLNCVIDGSHIQDIYHMDSVIWFSLQFQGVVEFNYYTNECNFYDENNSPISSYNFGGLVKDDNGNIFIGTSSGLIIYNEDKIIIDAFKYTDLYIYPNPFDELINLRFFAETDQNILISIYNEIGQIVYSSSVEVSFGKIDYPIEIGNFERGIYILKSQINNQMVTEKLMKIN